MTPLLGIGPGFRPPLGAGGIPRKAARPSGLLGLATILLVFSPPAPAWRCQSRLIEAGQSLFEVHEKCGDPQTTEHRTEWRLQTIIQPQCQTVLDPMPAPYADTGQGKPVPRQRLPRTICVEVPLSYSVPVETEIWYYDDSSVPKALHFENGRLAWIESLWHLRH